MVDGRVHDFRSSEFFKFSEETWGEHPIAVSHTSPAHSAGSLAGAGLANELDIVHRGFGEGVQSFDLFETRVDYVFETWDGERGFCDVGGEDDGSFGVAWGEDAVLQRGIHLGV